MATDLPGLTRLHVAPEANPDDLMCLPVRTVRQLTEAVGALAPMVRLHTYVTSGRCGMCGVAPQQTPSDGCCVCTARAALAPFRGGA